MRNSVVNALSSLAENDPDLILISGDLGFGVFEDFIDRFPKQFFNLGIGEQNMIGVAAGLALSGKSVFVYSIGNFPSFRCLEQIRNDICYHQLNVNILALGGGFNYGGLGMTHHATEDLSIMRALPNMTLVAPSNGNDAAGAVLALHNTPGASYLRLEKTELNLEHESHFCLGRARLLRKGDDCCIISTGGIVSEALQAAMLLSEQNIKCEVVDLHTLKPLDTEFLKEIFLKHKFIFTVEENTLIGGLYGAVSEYLVSLSCRCRLRGIGLNDLYSSIVGEQSYLRKHYNLDRDSIVELIKQQLST